VALAWVIMPSTIVLGQSATSFELPVASPSEVGLSAKKLAEVDRAMARFIENGELVGGIVMIARRGKVCFSESYGLSDREKKQPMTTDSLIRIYSMTKSITTAAALMLCEEGKMSVDDPVAEFIPELSTPVVVSGASEVPAEKVMTVADLMRHTSGLSYGWSNDRLGKFYRDRSLLDRESTLEEMASKMTSMPLRFEPGTAWEYGVSTDVLARVIEVVSGMPFEQFLQERLFDPLDMRDTGFCVPPENLSRLAACYSEDELKRLPQQDRLYASEPAFKSGGGGLVSTARDYMHFLMMIQRGGTLNGKRYLSAESVKSMTTNQLPKGVGWIRFGDEVREGVGFGFGFNVRDKMSDWDPDGRVGEYGWGGAASTHYWISPNDELIVITMEQVMPYRWLTEFGLKKQIYDAIID
ncbi:MAG: serine hydrolase domain-containing protein, partial [Planctomycetota bacterium]